jgi:hypothetical protein
VEGSNKGLFITFGLLLIVPFVITGCKGFMKTIDFDTHCGGHQKRAAEANTVETAIAELDLVIAYAEKHNLTKGSTGVIFDYPAYDVGFWYKNIKDARQELATLPASSSPLERTNVLMKLRESLTDNGQKGVEVTIPSGLAFHPHNKEWMIAEIVTLIIGVIGGLMALVGFKMD